MDRFSIVTKTNVEEIYISFHKIYKNSPRYFSFLSVSFSITAPLSITVRRMRIDLETHYSAHSPFSLPSYYRKTKLISRRAASFQHPPLEKRRGPRRKANFNFHRDNRGPPCGGAVGMPALSPRYTSSSKEGEDTVVDSRSAGEMNFIAQLGSFIGKRAPESARKALTLGPGFVGH